MKEREGERRWHCFLVGHSGTVDKVSSELPKSRPGLGWGWVPSGWRSLSKDPRIETWRGLGSHQDTACVPSTRG